MGGWGVNPFVEEHAKCVPYVVRCIRVGHGRGWSQAVEVAPGKSGAGEQDRWFESPGGVSGLLDNRGFWDVMAAVGYVRIAIKVQTCEQLSAV